MATWGEIAKELGYVSSDQLLTVAKKSNEEHDFTEEEIRRQHERNQFIPWNDIRAQLKCKPEIWARILRIHNDPRGLEIGSRLRGYNPKPTTMNNLMSFWLGPKQFIKMFGRQAYREIPKRYLHNKGHKKLISLQYHHIVGLKRIDLDEQEKNRRRYAA